MWTSWKSILSSRRKKPLPTAAEKVYRFRSPLGHGTILDNPVIKEIGLRYHKTAAQTALRWELQQDILPIPKSLNPERMAQNADIFDFNLTQEECLRITGLGETGRTGPDPDNIDF